MLSKKLGAKEVAEYLKLSPAQVNTLLQNNWLIDTKPQVEGAKKHYSTFDRTQVVEFRKEKEDLLKLMRKGVRYPQAIKQVNSIPTLEHAINSSGSDLASRVHVEMPRPAIPIPFVLTRIEAKVDALMAKVDALIEMWK
jgi:hypothetical protein